MFIYIYIYSYDINMVYIIFISFYIIVYIIVTSNIFMTVKQEKLCRVSMKLSLTIIFLCFCKSLLMLTFIGAKHGDASCWFR